MDAAARQVRARAFGRMTLPDILDALERAVGDPRHRPGFSIYSDHTELEGPIASADLDAMVAHLERLAARIGRARWAIVTRQPASYGMMRVLAARAQIVPLTVRVFYAHEPAQRWLEGEDVAGPDEAGGGEGAG